MPRISGKKPLILIVVVIAIFLIYFLPHKSRQGWETCNPRTALLFAPTVEQFTRWYVVLGGGEILWEGGRKLQHGGYGSIPINIWLVSVDEEKATFAYERIDNYYGAAPGNQQRFEVQCLYEVTNEDSYFQPRDPVLILRPNDLNDSWNINDYVEYVTYTAAYEELPYDELQAYFKISLPRSSFTKADYVVYVRVQQFNSEDGAKERFDNRMAILRLSNASTSELPFQLDDYTESCEQHSCAFIGRKGNYFMQVTVVSKPRLFGSETTAFPSDRWYQLINSAVDKLLTEGHWSGQ